MRRSSTGIVISAAVIAVATLTPAAQSPTSVSWAYGYVTDGPEPAPPPCPRDARPHTCSRPGRNWTGDTTVLHLPGTDAAPTVEQVQSYYETADWYPAEHPDPPAIVAHGRERDRLRSCAHCHYYNGLGKPENGHVAGLPVEYFLQQLALFRSGGRVSADPRKANHAEMIQIARLLTDAEARAAAEYYAAQRWQPWVRVVESLTAPKTRQSQAGLFIPLDGGQTEPLGQRIVEVPEQPERTEVYRDPKSGFVAYVPPGSIAAGRALVTTGGGRTTACTSCHGADLQGIGTVPPINDRTASYAMRQLWNYRKGTRKSAVMEPVVARLSPDDMIAIVAYLASL